MKSKTYRTKYYEQLHEKLQTKMKFTFDKRLTKSIVKPKEDRFEPINQKFIKIMGSKIVLMKI